MHDASANADKMYGLVAEFGNVDDLMRAAEKVRDAGYRKTDAHTAYPVEGLVEALGKPHTKIPWLIFGGGCAGFLSAIGMQYWCSVIDYPINIGGRPLFTWPAFIPIEFELTVLLASLTAVFSVILLSGLPQPYHPLFNVERFGAASRDGFFLSIESADPLFDVAKTSAFLRGLQAKGVYEVEA